jgi:hypothetical protein
MENHTDIAGRNPLGHGIEADTPGETDVGRKLEAINPLF